MLVCVGAGSLGSALHARASSIRNVKLPLGRQSTAKRGMGATGGLTNTLGSGGGASAAGEEKEGIFDGASGPAVASAKEGEGDSGKPKAVGLGEGGEAPAEKAEKVGGCPCSGVALLELRNSDRKYVPGMLDVQSNH